ncbi:MAG: hypothetical protein JNL03_13060 [Prolixibacteraceae bacterium]|nr:hypothetical protein [Prolixibacteraceae bacterium]
MEENHIDNVYALNLQDEEVFIGNVERGRKGYFCMGCKREMQAVKPKHPNIRPYFRHDVKALRDGKKCTYSDETYRHKLAKEILQINKSIKVPAVYKYPPKGVEGWPNLISEAKVVEAYSVGIERYFYEDENGRISYGKNDESSSKYLLLKPDVTFFDKNQNPILFIELVATHKVSEEKKIKLSRLGIDTIEITIPKDSPEAIGKALNSTNHTKWIYNYEQEITPYIPISKSSTEGIPPIDEIQRRLFEESYKCRAAQIGNLISTIKKCLGAEYYTQIERDFRSEISRIEESTKGHRDKWNRICEDRRTEIAEKLTNETASFESEKKRVEQEERKFQENVRSLEKRYNTKREKIECDTESYRDAELLLGGKEEYLDRTIENEEIAIRAINEEQRELEQKERNFGSTREQIERRFENRKRELFKNIERDSTRAGESLARIEENLRNSPEKFRIEEIELSERLDEDRRTSKLDFEARNKRIIREFEKGNFGKHGEFSREVEKFNNAMALLRDLPTKYIYRERIRTALEAIRSGAYKNWNK